MPVDKSSSHSSNSCNTGILSDGELQNPTTPPLSSGDDSWTLIQSLENDKAETKLHIESLDIAIQCENYFPVAAKPQEDGWEFLDASDLFYTESGAGSSNLVRRLSTKACEMLQSLRQVPFPFDLASIKWPTEHARELQKKRVEKYVHSNPELIHALSTAKTPSVCAHQQVIDKLVLHARATHRNISEIEMRTWVTTGENIAKALVKQGGSSEGEANHKALPVIETERGSLSIESNSYTVRALCWYMMASAAAQDIERETLHRDSSTSDMVTSGSMIMKDPGNAIYHFLRNSSGIAPRTSTHYGDRIGHDDQHSFFNLIPSRQSAQWDISDFEGLLPGHGGALLFDMLKESQKDGAPELFVKFEAIGCPAWVDEETYTNDFYSLHLLLSFSARISHNTLHAVEFVTTRPWYKTIRSMIDTLPGGSWITPWMPGSAESSVEIVRQEHLYKGVLEPIYSDLIKLFENAYKAGVEEIKENGKEISAASKMKSYGLPFALKELDRIAEWLEQNDDESLKQELARNESQIESTLRNLDSVSGRHNIQRRGAEVHISLDAEKVGARLNVVLPTTDETLTVEAGATLSETVSIAPADESFPTPAENV